MTLKIQTPTVLTVSGSDSTGSSGTQADIRTISALEGYAVSATTCLTIERQQGEREIYDLPPDVIGRQVAAIMADKHPLAIKVGLVRGTEAVRVLRQEIIGCRRLVVAPGVFASDGGRLIDDDTFDAIKRYLIPEALLLTLRCRDAEQLLGMQITNDDEMVQAAQQLHEMGAQWVLLRGGQHIEGRITALLLSDDRRQFFSSYNTEGWQRHGVGGALSAAITTRLALGDDVPAAISHAHRYIHAQVVYVRASTDRKRRPADLYNDFVSLLSQHYAEAHDVAFYADRLCITPRYLTTITDQVVGVTPKQVIQNFLTSQACQLLITTRLTVLEIAQRLGFRSEVAFCTFFRREKGKTPGEFRFSV